MLTAGEIDRRLREFYGVVDWSAAAGLVHVAAIESAGRRVIVPGPAAPASPIDRFVLGVARARADAIVTSGAVLRSEPELRHDLAETEADDRALRAWRHERLGKTHPADLVILSATGNLPIEHPAIQHASGGFIWTSAAGATALRARHGEHVGALKIVEAARSEEGISAVLEQVRVRLGGGTILVEAGPSVSNRFYRPVVGSSRGMTCDELLLDSFEGEVDESAVGPEFLPTVTIDAHFSRPAHLARVRDSSGGWRLARYRKAPG